MEESPARGFCAKARSFPSSPEEAPWLHLPHLPPLPTTCPLLPAASHLWLQEHRVSRRSVARGRGESTCQRHRLGTRAGSGARGRFTRAAPRCAGAGDGCVKLRRQQRSAPPGSKWISVPP